jgi:hypothetical protein
MRLPFFLPAILLLAGFGCSSLAPSAQTDVTVQNGSDTAIPSVDPVEIQKTIYTTFVINVHDWTEPEESIATLNRIIDLNEKYEMPVDFYLTDGMVQLYAKEAPDLIARLATSPYVAVSYHLRPPTPYYANFHDEWFDGLSNADLKTQLQAYEEHATDLATGKPTDAPGGYTYLKQLLGYPPYVVVQSYGSDKISKTLASIYKEMGAVFTLRHGTATALGVKANGLYLRPEDLEVKVYEKKTEVPVEEMIADALEELPTTLPAFLNLKWHEDNFYASGTGWFGIYFQDGNDRSIPFDPPYDLSNTSTQTPKSEEQQKVQWDRYEGMLQYMKDHPETYTVVNARDLLKLEAAYQ